MQASRDRVAVSTMVFGVTVVVLLAVAASGFALYAMRPAAVETTQSMSETTSMSTTGAMAQPAVAFVPAHGQMISSGWLVVAPLGNGSYAVSVYATGLETPSMGNYIVEAAQNSGAMANVPIAGSNATLSEFETDSHGTGVFFAILHQNPSSVFESVSVIYLPGMQMQNAMVVATAPLSMSTTTGH
jgi:hypothetical protein